MIILSTFTSGLVYIAEQTSPEENPVIAREEIKLDSVWFLRFRTILQSFNVLNRNKRMYDMNNVRSLINGENIQGMIKHNRWLGEQGHPMPMYEKFGSFAQKRMMEPYMENCSHAISRPDFQGNLLYGTIETLAGFKGPNMRDEMIRGHEPAFSARLMGYTTTENGVLKVHANWLTTYDWVLSPSHIEAEMVSQPVNIIKGASKHTSRTILEDATDHMIENCMTGYQDVFLPIGDLLNRIGNSDQNIQMMLEGWDMDIKNIQGVTKDGFVALQNGSNRYMAEATKKTKYEIMDYLASL